MLVFGSAMQSVLRHTQGWVCSSSVLLEISTPKSSVLKRGCPSTHTASRAPVGGCAWARALVPECVCACASRLEDCACLSPCVGDGYAPLVLSSLRSSSPSVATLLRSVACTPRYRARSLSCVVECAGGGLLSCVRVRACFLLSRVYLPSSLTFSLCLLLSAGTPALPLSLSLFTLSTDSPSPLGRSSRFNLPLVPRGIIHHSFTVVFILHTPRSFFSLLLVIF